MKDDRLIFIREHVAGLTQAQAADKMGVSRLTFHRWENRSPKISDREFTRFCAMCNVDKDQLPALQEEARNRMPYRPDGYPVWFDPRPFEYVDDFDGMYAALESIEGTQFRERQRERERIYCATFTTKHSRLYDDPDKQFAEEMDRREADIDSWLAKPPAQRVQHNPQQAAWWALAPEERAEVLAHVAYYGDEYEWSAHARGVAPMPWRSEKAKAFADTNWYPDDDKPAIATPVSAAAKPVEGVLDYQRDLKPLALRISTNPVLRPQLVALYKRLNVSVGGELKPDQRADALAAMKKILGEPETEPDEEEDDLA